MLRRITSPSPPRTGEKVPQADEGVSSRRLAPELGPSPAFGTLSPPGGERGWVLDGVT